MIGMKIVKLANTLRRMTFQERFDGKSSKDNPTSLQQWLLSYIWKHQNYGDIFQKDLEEAFKVRRSTATEVLKAMETKKLIIRTPLAEDKRMKKILLTDGAVEICKSNQAKIMQTEQQIEKGLTKEEISTFIRILEKIQNNLDDE